jgi:hypothetical protein
MEKINQLYHLESLTAAGALTNCSDQSHAAHIQQGINKTLNELFNNK